MHYKVVYLDMGITHNDIKIENVVSYYDQDTWKFILIDLETLAWQDEKLDCFTGSTLLS